VTETLAGTSQEVMAKSGSDLVSRFDAEEVEGTCPRRASTSPRPRDVSIVTEHLDEYFPHSSYWPENRVESFI
jgi:hypothetical protein